MKTLWAGVLGLAALALWLRLQPSSGGGPFDIVDVRVFLLVPIYLLVTVGFALAIARVVVRRGGLLALAGAAAVLGLALGVVWPAADVAGPWPWSILGYADAPE